MQEPVDKATRPVDLLWTAGIVVFASLATGLSAILGWATGHLTPAVSATSLVGGVAAGVLAARAAGRQLAGSAVGALSRWEGVALALFGAVALRQFGWIAFEREGALLTLLPYNYGDLPLHWTYVQYLAGGASFWPENPILSGERLRYPLGVDLLTALFVRLGASLPALLASMGLVGAALSALALRRWGGALGVAGFVFAGGLAGFQLLWTGRIEDYQSAVAWKNLFLALFVPQRGFLLALPAGLLLLWSGRRLLLRGEPGLPPWVVGVLWGFLPLVHLHTFLFVSLVLATWAVGSGRVRPALPGLAWALVPATWCVWQVTDGFRAASLVGWKPGWTIGEENPLVFLLVNFGLFLPLSLAALVVAARERRREELLVLTPALALFSTLFLVRLAPWEWDNTKVMLWCYLAALPPIGSLVLSRLAAGWRVATVVGLLFSGAVCVTGASLGRGPRLEVLKRAEYDAVCEALAGLAVRRVATAQAFNHPAALCGHAIVAGYPGHLWSHGLDAKGVEASLARLMRGEPGWREAARTLGASHVFWGRREERAFAGSSRPWREGVAPVAEGSWGALYRLE